MLDKLRKVQETLQEDGERNVPRVDMILITVLTTAIIIMPSLQYFIK